MREEPSKEILRKMFGTDESIDAYAEERKKDRLEHVTTLNEIMDVILMYAEETHKAQSTYEGISPFGGLDITVQSVDKVALSQSNLISQTFPEINGQLEIAWELKRRGYELKVFEDQIRRYETGEDLWNAWKKFSERKEELEYDIDTLNDQFEQEIDEKSEPLNQEIVQLKAMQTKLESDLGKANFVMRFRKNHEKRQIAKK